MTANEDLDLVADLKAEDDDPAHEKHDSMLEWVGGAFDPEAFDPAEFEANPKLGRLAGHRLRWPVSRLGADALRRLRQSALEMRSRRTAAGGSHAAPPTPPIR